MDKITHLPARLSDMAQTVTVGVIAALWPGRGEEEVLAWLADQAPARRRLWMALCLGGLLAFALAFAQFGWIGLAVYFALVIWLIR